MTTTPTQANRRPARPVALLVVALTMMLLASPAVAQAGTPKGFIGTVFPFAYRCTDPAKPVGCLSNKDLARMHRGHVGIVRWGFRWSLIQPAMIAPNWKNTDAMVGSLAARGIRVLPVLFGTPAWAAKTPETPPIETARARNGWKRFLKAAVQRYGPGGEYWTNPRLYARQHPGSKRRPIRSWQVWNEENIASTFPPKPSPHKYAKLLRITSHAITRTDPHAKIILGGMPGYVHPRAWQYLNKLYKQRRVKRYFDAVALHPYAGDVYHVTYQIKRMRKVMREHHDGHSGLWITELGWGSSRPDQFGINQGPKGQKQMLKKTFPRLAHHRHSWRLKHVFWFDWRDPPPGSRGCSFCLSSGLFHHNERAKPAWSAFKHITKPGRR